MTDYSSNTEKAILAAARKIFTEKGKDGTRMQEIADEAGINKAMLHYYFRNKQRLFEAVFMEAFQKILPQINRIVTSENDFFETLEIFIVNYINLIIDNPHIPGFILHELSQNPDNIAKMMGEQMPFVQNVITKIEIEIQNGNIKPIDPRQIFVNIIGLCIFPFVARPILQTALFNSDKIAYQQFLADRKTEVFTFIYNSIKA